MRKKLFFQNSANVNISDNYIETLLPDIPFYGIKGTICRIEVLKDDDDGRELCYYKVLYNHDGTINPKKVRVPRSKGKNFASLLNNYYEDLQKYLNLNHDKYLDYKTNKMKKTIDKSCVKFLVIASATLVVATIPILISTVYVGAIMEATFLLSLYLTNNFRKKIIADEKKQEFIKQYDSYQKELMDYNIACDKGDKIKRTLYTEISSKDHSLDKNWPKIKVLAKEENKEAA